MTDNLRERSYEILVWECGFIQPVDDPSAHECPREGECYGHAESVVAVGPEREPDEEGEAAAMLREFHEEADHPDANSLWLRGTLHREESDELIEVLQEWAGQTGTRVVHLGEKWGPSHDGIRKAIARELADVVYVAYGTALIAGIDLDAALREVHRANMQKVREGHRRDDGKIEKGPNFRPPDLTAAIAPGRALLDQEDADG